MNRNTTIIRIVVHFAVIIAVLVTTWSCTGNSSNTTGGTTADTANSTAANSDTTINMPPNANGQSNATNETVNATNAADAGNAVAGDTAFMMKAAEINMEEIKLGKLAQQKGSMAHVKELGKMMVTEHTQAMAGLTALAKTKMVNLPTAESAKAADDYKMLNAKSAKDFDKTYSDMMVNGHKEAIALFEKTNSETKDPAIKAMTGQMIPKLKTHLEHSEMCKKECEKM